jgi:hypothetical protein
LNDVIELKLKNCYGKCFERSAMAEYVTDTTGRLIYISNELEKILGWNCKDHIGISNIKLAVDDFAETAEYLTRFVLVRGGSIRGRLIPMKKISNELEECLCYASPIVEGSRIIGGRATFLPIKDLNIPNAYNDEFIRQGLWRSKWNIDLFQMVLHHLNLSSNGGRKR